MTQKAINLGNQPAFPTLYFSQNGMAEYCTFETQTENGLTRREYFAGLALQGIMGDPVNWNIDGGIAGKWPACFAKLAIDAAEALLEELINNQ